MELTNHRCQRGVRVSIARTIQFGDRRIFVGEGCTSISISRGLSCELAHEGEISPSMVDRLTNLVLVVANDNDTVVTVLRPKHRKAARHYFKPGGCKRRSKVRRRY